MDERQARTRVAKAVAVLALSSMVLNITLPWEMEGHWAQWSFVRKSISKVVNSGTAWAAISVYAGWYLRRLPEALVGGILAAEAALLLHYASGRFIGIYDDFVLVGNAYWFAAALVVGAPLALVGWLARRGGVIGLVAALVVPLGALVEPFETGQFLPQYPGIPWAERYSDVAGGVLLLALGVGGVLLVLTRARRTIMAGAQC